MGLAVEVRTKASAELEGQVFSYVFEHNRVLIGRSLSADICLPHRSVSKQHAQIEILTNHIAVTDLGSTNGVFLDRQLVAHRPKTVQSQQWIRMGVFELRVFRPEQRDSAIPPGDHRAVMKAGLAQSSPPTLTVLNGDKKGTVLRLWPRSVPYRLGRGQVDIDLPDEDVSRSHGEFQTLGSVVHYSDLGSKHGSFVGEQAVKAAALAPGDELRVGSTVLVFDQVEPDAYEQDLDREGDEPLPDSFWNDEDRDLAEASTHSEPGQDEPHRVDVPSAQSAATPDLLIVGLAAVVVLISVLGIWWIVR